MTTITEPAPALLPTTVDLTGLPEHVVREVLRYVEQARRPAVPAAGGAGPPGPAPVRFASVPPKMTPDEFKAQLAKLASHGTGRVLPPDWSPHDLYDEDDGR